MGRLKLFIPLFVFGAFFLFSCEKEITLDLPVAPRKLVVDGQIEQGQPPFVLLSSTASPFQPFNFTALESFFLRGATVTLSNGENTVVLEEICSTDLPPDVLPIVSDLTGLTPEVLSQVQICAYTNLDGTMWGEYNTTYNLEVNFEGETLTATTKINNPVFLDSLWFSIPNADDGDSLGFAFAILAN